MYQELERAMTEAERERLLACLPQTPSPFRPFRNYAYGLQVIGESFGMLLLAVVFIGLGKWPALYVIPALLGLLALWWLLHLKERVLGPLQRWQEANQHVWKYQAAVNAAQNVKVHCVEADRVVQMPHDEGTISLFAVGAEKTFWIDPSSLTPGHSPKHWPNQKFEVIELPGWPTEIGPFCQGKRLSEKETIEFRDLFANHAFEPPADGIIPQSLDNFLQHHRTKNRLSI